MKIPTLSSVKMLFRNRTFQLALLIITVLIVLTIIIKLLNVGSGFEDMPKNISSVLENRNELLNENEKLKEDNSLLQEQLSVEKTRVKGLEEQIQLLKNIMPVNFENHHSTTTTRQLNNNSMTANNNLLSSKMMLNNMNNNTRTNTTMPTTMPTTTMPTTTMPTTIMNNNDIMAEEEVDNIEPFNNIIYESFTSV